MEFERLAEIIANALNKEPGQIREDKKLKDLGADSLDIFQILYQIEDELQVRIDPSNAEKLRTVGDLAKEIERISKTDR
ncbi:MAG: acyl carrier protein [Lachnospiraceae bacterium]|nr:acyl carrier protein [Lachnospiraceae bacterium]